MEKKVCLKCGWVGNYDALVGDCGTQWCPQCHKNNDQFHEVVPLFETSAVQLKRIEKKLDYIMRILRYGVRSVTHLDD